jgi:hypothetical protein
MKSNSHKIEMLAVLFYSLTEMVKMPQCHRSPTDFRNGVFGMRQDFDPHWTFVGTSDGVLRTLLAQKQITPPAKTKSFPNAVWLELSFA